jgi:hypothetical protein
VYALAVGDKASPLIHRAVFWQDTKPLWFRDGVRLRDYARNAGYEVVDATQLAAFLRDRIADREASVVIFASERIPPDVDLAPYMESGGRVVWFGLPPRFVKIDPQGHDDLRVAPTASGRARGIPSWWVGAGGIPPRRDIDSLAADPYGRAVAWSKRFAAGEFLMLGGSSMGMDPVTVIRVAESAPATGESSAAAALDRMSALAGDWHGTMSWRGARSETGTITATYRVTAMGSAVVETLMSNGVPTMTSVYHLDGSDLRVTHYCGARNQPRLKADRVDLEEGVLDFDYVDATNLASPSAPHVNGIKLQFDGNDHLILEFRFVAADTVSYETLDLHRGGT